MTADQFDNLVNHESGLLGVSETSSDVRDLLARQKSMSGRPRRSNCSVTRRRNGSELTPPCWAAWTHWCSPGGSVRTRPRFAAGICEGLGVPRDRMDDGRNASDALLISTDEGPVKVRVIRTDEELMIARAAARLTGRPS